MTVDTVNGIGLEQIARGAYRVLHFGLNAELAQIESEMASADEDMASMRGVQYVPVSLEPVERENFHLGHVPSLIVDDSGWMPPLGWYPAVSVMAYRAQPSAGNAGWDQASSYVNALYVEALVKASQEEGEEVCDLRIWRTIEAINRVLMRDRSLGGVVQEVGEPTAIVSEVFTRPQSDENSEITWFWQAGRVEYGVDKVSPFE